MPCTPGSPIRLAPPAEFVSSPIEADHGAVCVRASGELDIATTPRLERTLREALPGLVVLDLRCLEFIDSAGVHGILNETIAAQQDGHRLVVLQGPPTVHRIFTLTRSLDGIEIGDPELLGPADAQAVQR